MTAGIISPHWKFELMVPHENIISYYNDKQEAMKLFIMD